MRKHIPLIIALLLIAAPALAVWPDDPALNLSVADRTGEQTLPKIVACPDGGCYIGWHDAASGNYDVCLQRLDALGNEAWPHNGIAVSTHPQQSWLCDWDLICDSAGNAVLVFVDVRAGGDWDVYAYRIAPDGSMLWGPDGVALSDDIHFEPTPRVCESDDGDFVFVWTRNPDTADAKIIMQRLAPDGTPLLAPGGIEIAGEPGESPGFCDVVPAGSGDVVVSWIRDMALYMSPRHLWAGKFAADGSDLWGGPVVVYSNYSLPLGYFPEIHEDGGGGGAIFLWHRSDGSTYNSFVQQLDAWGAPLFASGGLQVSDLATLHHISPTLTRDAASGDIYVFWDERNYNQNAWGIFGQRIDAAGNRAWGDTGMEFLPTNSVWQGFLRALPAPGGAQLFWLEETGGYATDVLRGFRVNSTGAHVWPGGIVEVATTPSNKGRLPAAQGPAYTSFLAWEDDRSGNMDVWAQNVNLDGSLGTGGTAAEPAAPAAGVLAAWPNPFNPATTLSFRLEEPARVDLSVYDASGSRVAALEGGFLDAGEHRVEWRAGGDLPSGVYLARLDLGRSSLSRRLVLLK